MVATAVTVATMAAMTAASERRASARRAGGSPRTGFCTHEACVWQSRFELRDPLRKRTPSSQLHYLCLH